MGHSSAPIGVFDSGIGGLNVLAACAAAFPYENFCYLGDNGSAPYGEKSRAELDSLFLDGVSLLLAEGVKAVVVACNTLSTTCLSRIRDEIPVPTVGTFPAFDRAEGCERVLLLATAATLRSEYSVTSILHFRAQGKRVIAYAPSFLVSDLEKNAPEWGKVGIDRHFFPLACDGVILGCTHFLFLRRKIETFYGAPCFDGTEKVLQDLRNELKNNLNDEKTEREIRFIGKFASRNREVFSSIFPLG